MAHVDRLSTEEESPSSTAPRLCADRARVSADPPISVEPDLAALEQATKGIKHGR